MSTVYRCVKCPWTGERPDYTDASAVERVFVSDSTGGAWEPRIVRHHVPLCPKCGFPARSLESFARFAAERTTVNAGVTP